MEKILKKRALGPGDLNIVFVIYLQMHSFFSPLMYENVQLLAEVTRK